MSPAAQGRPPAPATPAAPPTSPALPVLRRLAAVASCAVVLALGAAGPAAAQSSTAPAVAAGAARPGAIVGPEDRTEIAQSLAEATEESGVCFGYVLTLSGETLGGPGAEQASNGGPDAAPGVGASCPKGVVSARIFVRYTSESSESEDSANVGVTSTVPGLSSATARRRLDDLGLLDEGALLGDDDDRAVRNIAVALPLTLNTAVPAEEAAPAATAPNGDRLTGSPGSDWVRAHLVQTLVGAVLLVGAVVAIAVGWLGRKATGPRRPGRDGPSSPTPSSDTPSA